MIKQLSLTSILLAVSCAPTTLAVVPYPDEYFPTHKVEIVWPLDDGHYLAISGEYSCLIQIEPLKVKEGEFLNCRWVYQRSKLKEN